MGMMHRHKERLAAKLASLKSQRKTAKAEPVEEVHEAEHEISVEPEKKYLKNDIMRMPKAGLIDLAEELGIEDASEKTGNELKSLICEALNL